MNADSGWEGLIASILGAIDQLKCAYLQEHDELLRKVEALGIPPRMQQMPASKDSKLTPEHSGGLDWGSDPARGPSVATPTVLAQPHHDPCDDLDGWPRDSPRSYRSETPKNRSVATEFSDTPNRNKKQSGRSQQGWGTDMGRNSSAGWRRTDSEGDGPNRTATFASLKSYSFAKDLLNLNLEVREQWKIDEDSIPEEDLEEKIQTIGNAVSDMNNRGNRKSRRRGQNFNTALAGTDMDTWPLMFASHPTLMRYAITIAGARRKCVKLPLNLHSRRRLMWDLLSVILVCYDAVCVPLLLLVAETSTFSSEMDVICCLFWTLNIAVTFMTATYASGEFTYFRTWLAPDLIMVVPDWVVLLLQFAVGGLPALRMIRILRVPRLFRLLKIESVLQDQLKRINRVGVLSFVQVGQALFLLLMLNHILACIWYRLGIMDEESWLRQTEPDSGSLRGYFIALHWSVTQFHGSMEVYPRTTLERIFAVAVLFTGMMTFSTFISVITDLILQARQLRKKKTEHNNRLRGYLRRYNISAELTVGVKRYFEYHTEAAREFVEDRELLMALPLPLQKSVLLEARTPIIQGHKLLGWICSTHAIAFRELCHSAITASPVHAGHCVFNKFEQWQSMLFVSSGSMVYIFRGKNDLRTTAPAQMRPSQIVRQAQNLRTGSKLNRKHYCCEPALWIQNWSTRGEMISVSDTTLLNLEADRFANCLKTFPTLYMDVIYYSHWAFQQLQDMQLNGRLSDVVLGSLSRIDSSFWEDDHMSD